MKKNLKIKNKCGMDLSQTEELFHDLCGFAQKRFGFKRPPTLYLISDGENASKPLGKTAYYDPQSLAVTIYTDNRHTKDILRSLAHELVHHTQNENGMLNDTGYHGSGYAQKNKNLRQSEKEAYLKGNMCFRDWEDGLKESKPTIYNEWRINNMSTKKWKNNELMENVTRKFGFKMDLSQLNEASCGSKKEKYEEVYLPDEEQPDESALPWGVPVDPATMYRLDSEGNPQPMFPEFAKKNKVCPECKGKGDECKCPDKKELKEKEKKVKMVHKKDVEPGDKVVVPDGRGPLVGIEKEGMTESKLRGVIRKLIISEIKRK